VRHNRRRSDHSLFEQEPERLVTEGRAEVLAAPIDVALPARVGVLPIETAKDWRGPGPDDRVPPASRRRDDLAQGSVVFSLVTQTWSSHLAAFGMEGAARDRGALSVALFVAVIARCSRRRPRSRVGVGLRDAFGALSAGAGPSRVRLHRGEHVRRKTGLLMFTTRSIRSSADESSNAWHQSDKVDHLARRRIGHVRAGFATDVLPTCSGSRPRESPRTAQLQVRPSRRTEGG